MKKTANPRWSNGRRKKYRARFIALGLPCAICGKPIHYDEPSDSKHPLSFVIDEIHPVSRYAEFGYESREAAADDWDNLQPCHYCCNAWKSNKTIEEIKSRPARERAKALNLPDGRW